MFNLLILVNKPGCQFFELTTPVSTQFLLKFYALPLINMLCRSNNKTFCLWKHCSPAGSRMRRHLIPGSQREVSDDIDTHLFIHLGVTLLLASKPL